MKRLLQLLFVMVSLQAVSQTPSIAWSRALGGTLDDMVLTFQATPDNGAVMGGVIASKDGDVSGGKGKGDIWVVKLDVNGNKQWQKVLGGTSEDQGAMVYPTTDGGYIVGGNTYSAAGDVKGAHGGLDMWVVKLNSAGAIQWQKPLGGSNDDEIILVQQMGDGGYLVGGRTLSTNGDISGHHGDYDIFFAKLSSAGAVLWKKTLGSIGSEKLYSVQLMPDGGFVFVGYVFGGMVGNNGDVTGFKGNQDLWVGRVSASGDLIWNRALGGSGSDGGSLLPVRRLANGNLVISTYHGSSDGDLSGIGIEHGGWLLCLDPAGNIIWQKVYEKQTIHGMNTCADGGVITAKGTVAPNLPGIELKKFFPSGEEEWTKVHSATGTWYFNILHETSGGGFIGYGTVNNTNDIPMYHAAYDSWLIRFDASGNKIWERAFGGSNNDFLQGRTAVYSQGIYPINTSGSSSWQHYNPLIQAADGSFIIGLSTGSSNGDINGFHYSSKSGVRFDIWMAKITENQVPSVTSFNRLTPASHKAYPNPAKDKLILDINGSTTGDMVVEFYNTSGQLLHRSVNNRYAINGSGIQMDISSLPDGPIYYQVRSGYFFASGKFIKSR
jgi:hypothetical protein